MKREIVKIDEELCNGCGLCIPKCHEGALQIIDEKAVLVSDLMCDGLGACVGHCPQGALTIEQREAEPYDEIAVMKDMIRKGKNTVVAHLKHLKDHREHAFLRQGVQFLMDNKEKLDFNPVEALQLVHHHAKPMSLTRPESKSHNAYETHGKDGARDQQAYRLVTEEAVPGTQGACGCPGSREMSFQPGEMEETPGPPLPVPDQPSSLRQWPVQLHLINPAAGYFQGTDLLVAADCVAFAAGNFHSRYLRDKSLVIACPKLDSRQEVYREKITALIEYSQVNTVTVMIMEVPCCGGLLQMVQSAAEQSSRKVPVKLIQMGIRGQVLAEEWV